MTKLVFEGKELDLSPDEETFLRGIYAQAKLGEITIAECEAQARVVIEAKSYLDAKLWDQ